MALKLFPRKVRFVSIYELSKDINCLMQRSTTRLSIKRRFLTGRADVAQAEICSKRGLAGGCNRIEICAVAKLFEFGRDDQRYRSQKV